MKFFTQYISISSISPFINNESDFNIVRRQLLNKPTIQEHEIASRIAKTIDQTNINTVDNPLVKERYSKESKWVNNLIIHYTHENRRERCNNYERPQIK